MSTGVKCICVLKLKCFILEDTYESNDLGRTHAFVFLSVIDHII